MNPKSQKITLIGAGLVGSLAAVFLSRRGFEVEIFERRPDMRRETLSAGRSINLAVSLRGISALKEAGIGTQVLSEAIPMPGRMIHTQDGQLSFQPYGKDASECIYSISRGALNRALMTAAEATGKVKIHFNQRIKGADLDQRLLSLHHEVTGQESTQSFELVFGTDGSASPLRTAILSASHQKASETLLDYGYKELTLPAAAGHGNARFQMEKNALHIWPRGAYMLIALPNFDGSFTCTLFLPFQGPVSFASLVTQEDVTRFFHWNFLDATAMIPNLAEMFFGNPTGQMVTIKCSPWSHGGRALLLGDAAHAIVPFFGQGMNAGFEDLSILDRKIEKALAANNGSSLSVSDWSSLFSDFGNSRKKDTDAIADLAVEHLVEMRDKVADPQFLFERRIEALLQKQFPAEYMTRYSMVTFSRMPYRRAWEAGHIHERLLGELCRGITDPEQVNLELAHQLIREHLTPLVAKAKTEELRSDFNP